MSKYSLPEKKYLISEESALKTLIPFLERCDVDIDTIDEDKRPSVEKCINLILKGIRAGNLEIKEVEGEFEVKQNLQIRSKGSTVDHIIFGEYRARNHIDMDDSGSHVKQALSLMASVSKTNAADSIIKNMRSSDLSLLEALSTLFL